MRKSEENFEEVRLSPIEEESESMLCFKEVSNNFSKPEESGYRTKSPYKDYRRIVRKSEGNRNAHCELGENDIRCQSDI